MLTLVSSALFSDSTGLSFSRSLVSSFDASGFIIGAPSSSYSTSGPNPKSSAGISKSLLLIFSTVICVLLCNFSSES